MILRRVIMQKFSCWHSLQLHQKIFYQQCRNIFIQSPERDTIHYRYQNTNNLFLFTFILLVLSFVFIWWGCITPPSLYGNYNRSIQTSLCIFVVAEFIYYIIFKVIKYIVRIQLQISFCSLLIFQDYLMMNHDQRYTPSLHWIARQRTVLDFWQCDRPVIEVV